MYSGDLSLKLLFKSLLSKNQYEEWSSMSLPVTAGNTVLFLDADDSLFNFVTKLKQKVSTSFEIAGDIGYRWCSFVISDRESGVKFNSCSIVNFHTHSSDQIFFSIPDWIAFAKSDSRISLLITHKKITIYIKTPESRLSELLHIYNSINKSLPYNIFMMSFKKSLYKYFNIKKAPSGMELAAVLGVNVILEKWSL
jgi:hypothetical protein